MVWMGGKKMNSDIGGKKKGVTKNGKDDGEKKIEIKYRKDTPYSEILFWDKNTDKQYIGKNF